ncbi:MAG: 2-(1,2-epoxy-1,2-dihydrophenyl)acetyl-CoA isomerase PaaG [Rhodospirillales bacterium]
MNYETLSFTVADGAGRMTLNRPDRLNAMTPKMIEEIIDVLDYSAKDDAVRVLVMTGTGRGFCAGADLTGMGPRAVDNDGKIDIGPSMDKLFNPMIRKIRALEKPVVAAVNGVAAGGGANLALAADIVIAARSASFKQAFVAISLVPDLGGTYFLTHLLGEARAKGLAMLGDSLSAEQAHQWGMIWQVVDDAAFPAEVEKISQRLAEGPAALGKIKRAINAAPHNTLSQQLDLERDLQQELGRSHDFAEGVTAFLQKRKANFKGR